jgi:hypothetical protein
MYSDLHEKSYVKSLQFAELLAASQRTSTKNEISPPMTL